MLAQCVIRVSAIVSRVRCGNGVPGAGIDVIGVFETLRASSLISVNW